MTGRSSRRALFAGAAALPMLAGCDGRIEPEDFDDAEVLSLAAEARAIEARLDTPGIVADDDAAAEVALVYGLVGRMAATPALGLAGVAAKAGRICAAVRCGEGNDANTLAVSLTADLARLAPGAVAPIATVVRPSPDADLLRLTAAVRGCIAAHGQSRFEVWRDRKVEAGEATAALDAPSETRAIVNRLGFKRWNPEASAGGGGYWTYYFFPSGWKEATEGLNARAAAQALAAKGFLKPGAKQESRTVKLPGYAGGVKVYVVSGHIMGGDPGD